MTEHDPAPDRGGPRPEGTDPDAAWFRAAVDPVVRSRPVADGWDAIRRRVEAEGGRPRSAPPVRRPRSGWVLAAAALVVVAGLAAAVVAIDRDGGDEPRAGDPGLAAASSISTPPGGGSESPSTVPATTTALPPTTPATPPVTLVEVPAIATRVDLSSLGLHARYLDRADPAVREGGVVSQQPAPGTAVPMGSEVVVVMSGGGPVMDWTTLPPEARTFTGELPGYDRGEPIRRVPTPAGEAYKTDLWLFGPCPAVDAAGDEFVDPSYSALCYPEATP